MLAKIAVSYGLDPLMGELTAYQGRPYISIDGRYRKAMETGDFDGISTRPAIKEERVAWEIPDGDYFFRSEVFRKGISHPFVGWGRVRVAEMRPGSKNPGDTTSTYKPTQNNPQRMAEKRAEAQALRKGFQIDLPSAEDIGSVDDDRHTVTVTVEPVVEKKSKSKKEETPKGPEIVEVVEATVVEEPTPVEKTIEQEIEEHLPSVPVKAEEKPCPIDMIWLQDSLGAIQKKKLVKWTNAAVVDRLNNVTGGKAFSVRDAVALLTPQQAESFVAAIKETLEML
jgi:hypothetical protein